jgi:hypothetical protein
MVNSALFVTYSFADVIDVLRYRLAPGWANIHIFKSKVSEGAWMLVPGTGVEPVRPL